MNLLELARAALADDQIAALAATLGESATGTRQGLRDVAVPAVIAGLVRQFGRDATTGGLLADLLRDGEYGPLLAELDPALAGGVMTETLIHRGEDLTVGSGEVGPTTLRLRQALTDIQAGRAPDRFGWLTAV